MVRRFAALFLKLWLTFARRYGAQVEDFLEVHLKTLGLLQGDATKALQTRGVTRRAAAGRLTIELWYECSRNTFWVD